VWYEIMLVINQDINDVYEGIQSWDWIDFSGKEPFITSCFGDVFFESEDGIYFLDTLEGSFERIASSKSNLEAILNTRDGQEHFLMSGLATTAQEYGLKISIGECLDFKVSPVLGGSLEVENIDLMSFKLSLDMAGQIMKQVKDLPPGTKIDQVVLNDT
jgi:hypothetical protein